MISGAVLVIDLNIQLSRDLPPLSRFPIFPELSLAGVSRPDK